MKINSISASNPSFPDRLRVIPQSPKELFIAGELAVYPVGVAIVGTRKPTSYGRQITTSISERLAERGVVIISGLAHGIDGLAHEACVKVRGTTIAVLPAGLDRIYPSTHRSLADRIISTGGVLLSEYSTGTPPLQHRFLERNRLVSGLADIIVITEASIRSGTMNTAAHALEQGKDVYAVPGPITSAMSAGCNALIAQGATPITSIDDFVDRIAPAQSGGVNILLGDTREEQKILDLISGGISDGEVLQKESGLDAALFTQTLTMLEIRGVIRPLGANHWGP